MPQGMNYPGGVMAAAPGVQYYTSTLTAPNANDITNMGAGVAIPPAATATPAAPASNVAQVGGFHEVEAPTPQTEYFVRELDGTWTLHSMNKIMQDLQPGTWAYAHQTGRPYWIRQGTA